MGASLGCDVSRLKRYLSNDLPEEGEAELARHLDTCRSCQRALEEFAAGSDLWDGLRRLSDSSDPGVPSPPGVAVAPGADEPRALGLLDPPDDPNDLGRLGPYRISAVLGRGGMGVVFKAFDPALDRHVAVKILGPQFAASAEARHRFRREARAAAAVVHEHVVAIHAVDSWKGLPYLVMQYVPGRSLQERLDRDGPLEAKEILRIGMQAAAGLAAAHAQGLVHRDVKPSNILLENGVERVKLTDFGLARPVGDAGLTQGCVAGTPQYMSPEQARGGSVDARSDLFSLGSVLYAMAAGSDPFPAADTTAVLKRVCDDRPRPVRELNPEVPGWLAAVIETLHAKDPADRYPSADEVERVLGRHLAALQHRGPGPRAAAPATRARPPQRHLWAAAVLLGLAAVGLGFSSLGGFLAGTVRQGKPAPGAGAGAGGAAPAAETSHAGQGALLLGIIDPNATVRLDDKEQDFKGVGQRPIWMSPGLHRVRVIRPKGPETVEIVEVVADCIHPVDVTPGGIIMPAGSSLLIENEDPKVKIRIDDRRKLVQGVGQHPIPSTPGPHRIWIIRPGQPGQVRTVEVPRAGARRIEILKPTAAARPPNRPLR